MPLWVIFIILLTLAFCCWAAVAGWHQGLEEQNQPDYPDYDGHQEDSSLFFSSLVVIVRGAWVSVAGYICVVLFLGGAHLWTWPVMTLGVAPALIILVYLQFADHFRSIWVNLIVAVILAAGGYFIGPVLWTVLVLVGVYAWLEPHIKEGWDTIVNRTKNYAADEVTSPNE